MSTWYTVMAVTDPTKGAKGISAFVVHADDPGFVVGTKERKLGIKGSSTREIHFENCRIPGNRIIGAPGTGFKTALATLDHTRPTIGAQAIGIAQGALDVGIAYVKERKQFGKKLAEFQALQFMIADMAMEVEAACYTSVRAASTSMAMSAIMNCRAWNSASFLPNCLRSLTYAMPTSSAPWAIPIAWAPMVGRV